MLEVLRDGPRNPQSNPTAEGNPAGLALWPLPTAPCCALCCAG